MKNKKYHFEFLWNKWQIDDPLSTEEFMSQIFFVQTNWKIVRNENINPQFFHHIFIEDKNSLNGVAQPCLLIRRKTQCSYLIFSCSWVWAWPSLTRTTLTPGRSSSKSSTSSTTPRKMRLPIYNYIETAIFCLLSFRVTASQSGPQRGHLWRRSDEE